MYVSQLRFTIDQIQTDTAVCCKPSTLVGVRRHLNGTILVLSKYSASLGESLMSRILGFSLNVLFFSYFELNGLCKSDIYFLRSVMTASKRKLWTFS